jgi:hypothetical protein
VRLLVNLVEDWKDIEVYTRRLSHDVKTGSYMLRKAEDGAEIKVRVGQFGYAGRFKDQEDPELIKILAFCAAEGFFKIKEPVVTARSQECKA